MTSSTFVAAATSHVFQGRYASDVLGDDFNVYSLGQDTYQDRKGILTHMLEAKMDRRRYGTKTRAVYGIIPVALDTGSDTPMVRRGAKCLLRGKNLTAARTKDLLFTFRQDMLKHVELKKGRKLPIRTANGTVWTDEYAPVWVRNNDKEGVILARVCDEADMPHNVDLLLDGDTIGHLEIDINKIMKERQSSGSFGSTHVSTAMLPTLFTNEDSREEHLEDDEWVKQREQNAAFVAEFNNDLPSYGEIHLSEANCRARLEAKAELFKEKKFTLEDIDICDDLTKKQKQALISLVRKYKRIFAKSDSLPDRASERLVPTVNFKTSPGAKPASCMKPRWGKYQEAVLRQWARKGISEGLLVRAPTNCAYACRPHIVTHPLKPDKLRVTWDNRLLNESLVKIAVNTPSMEDQLLRHAGARYFTSTDALRGFYHLELDPEAREKVAIWTPLGLFVPTRLVEGNKNAATYFQNFANQVLEELSAEARQRTSNYADDFLTSGRDFVEYLRNTESLFKACQELNMTLSPKKTQLGYPSAKLLGREVSENQIKVHGDNLKALRNSAVPCTKSELRSFLGICNYANKHVENFRAKSIPFTNLLKKNAEWKWDPATHEAYEKLRDEVCAQFPLHTMDPAKPLYLSTDASDFGMGCCLFQLKNPVDDEHLSKMGGSNENKQIIAFHSASFNAAMQRKPIYYREARAIIWALEKTVHHTRRSEHQVVVCTDHQPLKWLKNSNRGQVTAWLLENVADIDFRIVYVPGKDNETADICSRPPMVSPTRYNLEGATQVWRKLLTTLPSEWIESKDLHVWAAQHTADMQRVAQASRRSRGAIDIAAPATLMAKLKGNNGSTTMLLAPPAESGPVIAHKVIAAHPKAKLACLIQTDLLQYVETGGTERVNPAVKEAVKAAAKLTFSRSNYTWIVFNEPKVKDKVFTVEDLRMEGKSFEAVKRSRVSNIFLAAQEGQDLSTWIEHQKNELAQVKKDYGAANVMLRSEDSLMYVATKSGLRVYVPKESRKKLVMRYHEDLEHAMENRLVKALSMKYVWPRQRTDVNKWVADCEACPLSRARKNLAHNQYSPTAYRKPRSAYGIDFYGIAESSDGFNGVLTIVDLHTRFVRYTPVKDASAATVVKALQNLTYERGAFATVVSDGAKAIVGKVVSEYCKAMKIEKIHTFYHPQGNSITERNHVVLGEYLRRLPPERRPHWPDDLPKLAYAVNMCVNTTTNYTPFELDTGYTPDAPGDIIFIDEPSQEDVNVDELAAREHEHHNTIKRVKELHYLAKAYADAARMVTMEKLNREGGPKVVYKPGDKVAAYIPPPASQNDKNPWKTKHRLAWRKGTILERKGNTTYQVQLDEGTTILRNVSLLQKWRAEESVTKQVENRVIADERPTIGKQKNYLVGDYVAVPLDDDREDIVEIAIISKKKEGPVFDLRYLGTVDKDKKPATKVYKPAFITTRDGAMVLGKKPAEPNKAYVAENWSHDEITGRLQLKKTSDTSWKLSKESAKWIEANNLALHCLKPQTNKSRRKRRRQ